MSSAPAQAQPPVAPAPVVPPAPAVHAAPPAATIRDGEGAAAPTRLEVVRGCKGLLFDLTEVDLTQRLLSREGLEGLNPHRDQMALLDWIVWHSADYTRGVALKHTRDDEFWVKGHFPGKPMFPGVLMIESAAQLAVYLYNARLPAPRVAAFTRIDKAVFRAAVVPGDDLYLLCQEVKWTRRGFTCDVQGVVNGHIAFEAQVQGLAI